MNLSVLCDGIGLHRPLKERVLSFGESFDFQKVDGYQEDYRIYHKMQEARLGVQAVLGEDADGIKMLACMLKACVDLYELYQAKGIPEDIYFATMACFPRFINETCKMTGKWCFDRHWWTTRQAGFHLFRVGELEYELKPIDKKATLDVHIPSDADFSPAAVDRSLQAAHGFFEKYFPAWQDAEYHCNSWLLDPQLGGMLAGGSNILNFQNRFEIYNEEEPSREFIEWIFKTKSADYDSLLEDTSLQRNVKKHLLAGGMIKNAYGRMKDTCR